MKLVDGSEKEWQSRGGRDWAKKTETVEYRGVLLFLGLSDRLFSFLITREISMLNRYRLYKMLLG